MAATLLTFDRGNTTLDVMAHGAEAQRRRFEPSDLDGIAAFVAAHPATPAVGLSVVVGGLEQVASLLGDRLALAGRDLPCPLEIDYPDASQLGVDRWVGALAAHTSYGAAIIADCGTALTVNAVDRAGVFRGGAIAPGAETMARALAAAAPALPLARLDVALELPARRPEQAVDAGVQLGFVGQLEHLVREVAQAVGLTSAAWVLTGGGARVYLRHGSAPFHHHDALIHEGLRCLFETSSSSS